MLFSLALIDAPDRDGDKRVERGRRADRHAATPVLEELPAVGLWMLTQAAQIAAVLGSIGMYFAAFFSLYYQMEPCMLKDDAGRYRLNRFLQRTVFVQPELVGKAALVFVYCFILSIGALVGFGFHQKGIESKDDFKRGHRRRGLSRGVRLRRLRSWCCVVVFAACFCMVPRSGSSADGGAGAGAIGKARLLGAGPVRQAGWRRG